MFRLGNIFPGNRASINDDLTQNAEPPEKLIAAIIEAKTINATIIGTGNGGCALAADLMSKGLHICLYAHPAHAAKLDSIRQRGTLISKGVIKGEFKPELLTEDMQEAVSFADNLIVAVPSYAQNELYSLMAPHLTDNHVVVNLNGNFGSLCLLKEIKNKRPILVETNVVPHASRVSTEGVVTVLGIKKFLTIGALPPTVSPVIKEVLEAIIPCRLEWCSDVLEVAFQSNNGVLHPAACVLNAGWIESKKGNFYFYKDGISPAVGRVIEQIDHERIEIGKRYGFELRTLLDEMLSFYGGDYKSISEFALKTKLHNKIKEAPSDTRHRYISEDVPFALVPWYELGVVVNFEAKTMKSIIDLSATINVTDYMKTGRNLQELGLAGLDQKAILDYVNGIS